MSKQTKPNQEARMNQDQIKSQILEGLKSRLCLAGTDEAYYSSELSTIVFEGVRPRVSKYQFNKAVAELIAEGKVKREVKRYWDSYQTDQCNFGGTINAVRRRAELTYIANL